MYTTVNTQIWQNTKFSGESDLRTKLQVGQFRLGAEVDVTAALSNLPFSPAGAHLAAIVYSQIQTCYFIAICVGKAK